MAVSFRLLSTLSLLSALGFVTLSPAVAQTPPAQGRPLSSAQVNQIAELGGIFISNQLTAPQAVPLAVMAQIMGMTYQNQRPEPKPTGGAPEPQLPQDACSAEIDPKIDAAARKVQGLMEAYYAAVTSIINRRQGPRTSIEREQLTGLFATARKKVEDALCDLFYWQNVKKVCQDRKNQQNNK